MRLNFKRTHVNDCIFFCYKIISMHFNRNTIDMATKCNKNYIFIYITHRPHNYYSYILFYM